MPVKEEEVVFPHLVFLLCLCLASGWSMSIRILNWGSYGSEIVDCGLVVRDAMYRFIIHRSLVKLELKFLI